MNQDQGKAQIKAAYIGGAAVVLVPIIAGIFGLFQSGKTPLNDFRHNNGTIYYYEIPSEVKTQDVNKHKLLNEVNTFLHEIEIQVIKSSDDELIRLQLDGIAKNLLSNLDDMDKITIRNRLKKSKEEYKKAMNTYK